MMPPDNPMAGAPTQGGPFAAIETFYDPESIRLLYARGIDEGWRCLEVGGGGGSIAKWLLSRCGDYGRIVVTDIDVSHMAGLQDPKLEVDEHDIVTDPVPEDVFHMAHERLVLGDLVERDVGLQKMITTIRPGGMLVIEELDRATLAPAAGDEAAVALFNKVINALRETMRSKGLDPDYGRQIYRRALELGLTNPMARGGSVVQSGGSPAAAALKLDVGGRRDALLASGSVSSEDLSTFDALLDDESFAFMSATMIMTWAWKAPRY
jgi:hypothetical protein